MQATVTITPAQLPDLLLTAAPRCAPYIWGPPGIGKSALVRKFAADVGLPCVTLLGTQLAAEDLIGVPQLYVREDGQARSRFAPPDLIARNEPYVLFADELNASSPDVQKAFYSLVLDRRLGDYELPAGSVVIGAGNRAADNSLARTMPAALVNRFLHVHLESSTRDWLAWAAGAGVHPLVLDYVRTRPDHLWSAPPKTEQAFSTPRSWHMLSELLVEAGVEADGANTARTEASGGPVVSEQLVRVLACGLLTPAHAENFVAFVKASRNRFALESVIRGDLAWPNRPEDRDLLYLLASSFRARLIKELPADKAGGSSAARAFAHRAKAMLTELSEVSVEMAQLVVGNDDDGHAVLPGWFLTEVVRDLPRLVAARS